ncbi:Arginine metabolism regulation protein iii [Lasiodiplodia theobromae]|uniref:Kinase n=1 Tax=Lasiodiplodia theobromae TaxID=45133 RepID=A0A5N5DPF2_9PEZI|nr:Arginine metabolism regulation protein iii [Lasiodiplodia theobromae]KAB2579490.1 Inositol polyphosphate multikinase [Lasiodiplodia theobromae]KAF4542243.1 Arginine metabolism regulation protein iii [Lasiodiplodia theobromae]
MLTLFCVINSDGVLSDPTGALVIKPCTAAEIAFYESANASHQALATYMPTFMGTLELNKSPEVAALAAGGVGSDSPDPSGASTPAVPPIPEAAAPAAASGAGTAASLALDDVGPMKGKKLSTDTSIVLENVAAGFRKPNILDLKLGARLYDDGTAEAKRARLDKVASETTSSSLGFRIAGMRVWQGEGGGEPQEKRETDEYALFDEASRYKTFNKLYGRVFNAENVVDGFKEYFLVPGAGHSKETARPIIARLLKDVKGVQAALEAEESRMYSASLLFVYEGDAVAAKEAEKAAEKAELDALQTATAAGEKALNEEDDDEVELDDDEADVPKFAVVKLIDFAHATFRPGQGPDENALRGIRSVAKILEDLEAELAKA